MPTATKESALSFDARPGEWKGDADSYIGTRTSSRRGCGLRLKTQSKPAGGGKVISVDMSNASMSTSKDIAKCMREDSTVVGDVI